MNCMEELGSYHGESVSVYPFCLATHELEPTIHPSTYTSIPTAYCCPCSLHAGRCRGQPESVSRNYFAVLLEGGESKLHIRLLDQEIEILKEHIRDERVNTMAVRLTRI